MTYELCRQSQQLVNRKWSINVWLLHHLSIYIKIKDCVLWYLPRIHKAIPTKEVPSQKYALVKPFTLNCVMLRIFIYGTDSPLWLCACVCSVLISGAGDGSRLPWSHLISPRRTHSHTRHIRPRTDWFWLSRDLGKGRWMGNQFGVTFNHPTQLSFALCFTKSFYVLIALLLTGVNKLWFLGAE